MLRLIYTSEATRPLTPVEIIGLCAQSRRNNSQVEVTGLLLVNGGRFLQVMEGPRTPVEDTFLRIIADPRHHNLVLLSREVVTKRGFGDWAMAHHRDRYERDEILRRVQALTFNAPRYAREAFKGMFDQGWEL